MLILYGTALSQRRTRSQFCVEQTALLDRVLVRIGLGVSRAQDSIPEKLRVLKLSLSE